MVSWNACGRWVDVLYTCICVQYTYIIIIVVCTNWPLHMPETRFCHLTFLLQNSHVKWFLQYGFYWVAAICIFNHQHPWMSICTDLWTHSYMYGFDLELPTDSFPLFHSLTIYLIEFDELVGLDEIAMVGVSSLSTDPGTWVGWLGLLHVLTNVGKLV